MLEIFLKQNRKNFIENGGYKMYKYNMSDKISKNAVDFFNSAIEEKNDIKPEQDDLLIAKTVFEEQVREIEKQKLTATEKLDLKKVSDLDNLIKNIEVKIAEIKAKIKEKEDSKKNPEEEKVFKKLRGEEEQSSTSDYDHDKLVESTYSFLKKLDYATAENLLSKNSQLKKDLGNDFEIILGRLKEDVGRSI